MKSGPLWVLGTMSGTSLDGVDAALLKTDGRTILEFGESAYRPYSEDERQVLRCALGKWPGETGVAEAAEIIEQAHAEVMMGFDRAAMIGFHGQTLAHDPKGRGTHQAGDGRVLAEALSRPVVWDFRSSDVEMGGQGAPLAPVFHFAAAKWAGCTSPVAFLNLGGVGNLTLVDPSRDAPDQQGALLAFDTGPANAPIDDLIFARRGQRFDDAGALAASGTVDQGLISRFLNHSYFAKIPPKSLDRNDFKDLVQSVQPLSDGDAAATLTEAVVVSVLEGLRACPVAPRQIFVTGGGRKNPLIMAGLAERAGAPVLPVEEIGLDGDMLEAQAFAFLAMRVFCGLVTSFPSTTGVAAAIGGGRISRPSPRSTAQTIENPGGARSKPSN